jgi:anhydro-N-acetylmuramic acid kinase
MFKHYIGLMSGTSVDGIDAVAIALGPENKPDQKFRLLAAHIEPFAAAVADQIRSLMKPGSDGLDAYGALDMELGALFAKTALDVAHKAGLKPKDIRAIGSHGQTVRHRPNGQRAFTLQIGNPSLIAESTGITTVADFRSRDVAAGGQGAPLVPAFHRWLFHSPTRNRAIINIGGIANITHVPTSGPTAGFDTGPGNTLLDQWVQKHLGKHHDENGAWAAGGKVHVALLQKLNADPYFAMPHPKSTGREYFHLGWLDAALAGIGDTIAPQDVQATLVELTASTIAKGIGRIVERTDEIYVCGGGGHNAALMRSLERHISDVPIQTTEVLGLHPDWVEACAFAWLAHRRLEGLPGNVPNVTGARHTVVLGGLYAGAPKATAVAEEKKGADSKKGG